VRRVALAALGIALAFPTGAAAMPFHAGFVPSDPLFPKQYYVSQDHAFDAFGSDLPATSPVRVAIVDSGIDGTHPEFRNRVIAQRSFVGGSPLTDEQGHGTFVAGEIAAAMNGEGIAGIAFPAQLIIAKIARGDEAISVADEAAAIRWAADKGAQVINLSIGGLRDPLDRKKDTFSSLEANAVEYAYRHGAVLVAAIGNGDEAPSTPWPYGSYPAALPHVVGVSALTPSGNVPMFSNRDLIYNDIAAPGMEIFSTLPRSLTAQRPVCVDQGYSDCGPPEFRTAEGTSYAAAQVSAAAALLLATRPTLSPDQVMWALERSSTDMTPGTGCAQCAAARDRLSGWGELDLAAALRALDGSLPPRDHYEGNDDAGGEAFALYGRSIDINATLDYWDDQIDVYKIRLKKDQTVAVSLQGPSHTDTNMILWRPGTLQVEGLSARLQARRVTLSAHAGPNEHFLHRAGEEGWYFVEIKLTTPGSGPYHLHISKSPV
jgi:subtilisin family serine protease